MQSVFVGVSFLSASDVPKYISRYQYCSHYINFISNSWSFNSLVVIFKKIFFFAFVGTSVI